MKIDRSKRELGNYSSLGKTGLPEVQRGKESVFEQELTYRQEEAVHVKMAEILSEIDKLSDRISKSFNINDLMLYKKLVKNFLREASSEAYELIRRRGRNRSGRTVLVTIKTIDREVEALINDFRDKKKEPMEILQALDKIRGMMVDLMV
jgi:uncharacterized protein YaaR (DUF327 family)